MALLVEFSARQFLYTNWLTNGYHCVTPKKDMETAMRFNDAVGHIWIPRKIPFTMQDLGVVRGSDHFLNKHSKVFNEIDWTGLISMLNKLGSSDDTRDVKDSNVKRIDFGYANHDYDRWSQKPYDNFRDKPMLCKVDDIIKYKYCGKSMAKDFATLLDTIMIVLNDIFDMKDYDMPLCNEDIQGSFIRNMQDKLGCRYYCFPAGTIGFQIFDEDAKDVQKEQESQRVVDYHTDNLNGEAISAIFHQYMRFETPDRIPVVLRLFLIPYTRKSIDHFLLNESCLTNLKENIVAHSEKIKKFLSDHKFLLQTEKAVDIEQLLHITISKEIPFKTSELQLNDGGKVSVQHYPIPASIFPEVPCSAGITILRKVLKKLQGDELKFMEVLLLASYQHSWARFYYGGLAFLHDESVDWTSNLAVQMASVMTTKFGGWHGGLGNRGHPISLDFISHYSNKDTLTRATVNLHKFLVDVDADPNLTLIEYQKLVHRFASNIVGLGEWYAQRIPLLAAGSTAVITTNIRNATLGYPIQNVGNSYNEIEAEAAEQQRQFSENLERLTEDNDKREYIKVMEEMKLDPSLKGFAKSARLACRFAGLSDNRKNWGEYIYCDALGTDRDKMDHLYPEQCMYTFKKKYSRLNNSPLIVHEKQPKRKEDDIVEYRPIYDWKD